MFDADLLLCGSATQVVGLAFLGNAALLSRPRRAIEDFFGAKPETLRACQDQEVRKIQSLCGFAFLFLGFALQIGGFLAPPGGPGWLLAGLLGLVLALAAAAGVGGSAMARATFKRHLREFFQRTPWPFDKNIPLTKEIGEVFGIGGSEADTVEEYVTKVRRALGLPEEAPRASRARDFRPKATPARPGAVGF